MIYRERRYGIEGCRFSCGGEFILRPKKMFRPTRIVPRGCSVDFWDAFRVISVQIGTLYQGPKGIDWDREHAGEAERQEDLDAFVYDTMHPQQDMRILVECRRESRLCEGFDVEGLEPVVTEYDFRSAYPEELLRRGKKLHEFLPPSATPGVERSREDIVAELGANAVYGKMATAVREESRTFLQKIYRSATYGKKCTCPVLLPERHEDDCPLARC